MTEEGERRIPIQDATAAGLRGILVAALTLTLLFTAVRWLARCLRKELIPYNILKEQTMSLNQLFETIEKARETAHWRAAFGEPHVVEGRTLIPVARVSYGFGLGFGSGTGPAEQEGEPAPGGEGGGAGGGASAKPLGVIVVTPEAVYFEETTDEARSPWLASRLRPWRPCSSSRPCARFLASKRRGLTG